MVEPFRYFIECLRKIRNFTKGYVADLDKLSEC